MFPLCFTTEWKRVAALLAVYGFLKEVRPSEPFITQFLTGSDKGFTDEQVNQQIYPVSTYATLALLVVVFLVTDYLRYKPIIVLQCVSAVVVYSIISWGQGLAVMQFMEVLYGLMFAGDVAYFTYMYAKVSRAHYGTVSATARVGYLLGRCGSGVLSQVAVTYDLIPLLGLQYITLGSSVAATLLALVLPGVKMSVYFHKDAAGVEALPDAESRTESVDGLPSAASPPAASGVLQLLWTDCRDAYSQLAVVKWSLWWAFATAGQMMVLNYVQILWQAVVRENAGGEQLWNGAVEAAYTLLGACAVWLTTRKKDYTSVGDALLGVWTLGAGAIVILASRSQSMAVQYGVYVAFATSYQAAITVANSEVAKRVREDAHGLVFGINILGALLLQTVLTFTVAGEGGLELNIKTQFIIYGGYFCVIGLAFLVVFVVSLCTRTCGGGSKRK